jgi:hypothetical protein
MGAGHRFHGLLPIFVIPFPCVQATRSFQDGFTAQPQGQGFVFQLRRIFPPIERPGLGWYGPTVFWRKTLVIE